MGITLNGQQRSFEGNLRLSDLLARLQLGGRYAVERNGEIVPRSHYAQTLLAEGDRVEIVQAIGGG